MVPGAIAGSSEGDADTLDSLPTRYGFTNYGNWSVRAPSMALCVATGDIDGSNNDDVIIGYNGGITIYYNSGTGASFPSTQTFGISGLYIVKIKTADYDNDGDTDIIALGQEHYFMANDLNSEPGAVVGDLIVYYLKNTLGVISLGTSYPFTDALYNHHWWFVGDGVFDFDVKDVDNDNDVDAVVMYNRDNDGNAGDYGEGLRITALLYDKSLNSLSASTVRTIASANSGVYLWGQIRLDYFGTPEDAYPDIVFSYGGYTGYTGASGTPTECQVWFMWHTGSGASWNTPLDLAEGGITKPGIFTYFPYALATGHFTGPGGTSTSARDVAVSTNSNFNNVFTDGSIYLIKGNKEGIFLSPEERYTEGNHYQMRALEVGNFNNATGDRDLIIFTKQDLSADPSPWDGIEGWGISMLKAKNYPFGWNQMKYYSTKDGTLPNTQINAVGVGDFDGKTEYDDIVIVGENVTVWTVGYPPNNRPVLIKPLQNPSPVLNNDKQTVILNLTVKDKDGSWDMTKCEIDLTPLGLPKWTSPKNLHERYVPTGFSSSDNTIGYYETRFKIPETTPEGNYEIEVTLYDRYIDNYLNDYPDSTPAKYSFTFRIEQYNRPPVASLPIEERTLSLLEDTTAYWEGVYGWFSDPDFDDPIWDEELNITLRNEGGQWISHNNNDFFLAELKNGSGEDPESWSLKITPKPNAYHTGASGEYRIIELRAEDRDELRTESAENPPLKLTIDIIPVNDPPVIKPQGIPDPNFNFLLVENDPGSRYIIASDAADFDPKGLWLSYGFDYDVPADENWLKCSREGEVTWAPTNSEVGPHKVLLWVDDGGMNVTQVLWFNVTNLLDPPYFVSVSNTTHTYELPKEIHGRYEFTVLEHEEFEITIIADDLDFHAGYQEMVTFQCNLTNLEETYLEVDPKNPFKATLRFMAEKRYGYFATVEPDFKPLTTEIIIVDELDDRLMAILPLEITIINVNDPPINLSIDYPEDGAVFETLFNHEFRAGAVLDPDNIYGENLTFMWDFDASDGFQTQEIGDVVFWDFDQAGTYNVTLRVVDSGDNTLDAFVHVTVNGSKNLTDFDNDGLPNEWEEKYGLNPYDPTDAHRDNDRDGWDNLREFMEGTDPLKQDTDGDNVWDSEDYDPLDHKVKYPPKEDEDNTLLWIIIIIIVILILIIVLVAFFMVRNRRKAKEEEEKRRQAEELQRSLYEGQDLYSDLPELQKGTLPVDATAPQAQLPPPDQIEDIFGGAGMLPTAPEPTAQPSVPSLPPAQAAVAPAQPQTPGQPPSQAPRSEDLTDLLD